MHMVLCLYSTYPVSRLVFSNHIRVIMSNYLPEETVNQWAIIRWLSWYGQSGQLVIDPWVLTLERSHKIIRHINMMLWCSVGTEWSDGSFCLKYCNGRTEQKAIQTTHTTHRYIYFNGNKSMSCSLLCCSIVSPMRLHKCGISCHF